MSIISTKRAQDAARSLSGDARFGAITEWISGLRRDAEVALIESSDMVQIHRMQGRIEVLDALMALQERNEEKPVVRPEGYALRF